MFGFQSQKLKSFFDKGFVRVVSIVKKNNPIKITVVSTKFIITFILIRNLRFQNTELNRIHTDSYLPTSDMNYISEFNSSKFRNYLESIVAPSSFLQSCIKIKGGQNNLNLDDEGFEKQQEQAKRKKDIDQYNKKLEK